MSIEPTLWNPAFLQIGAVINADGNSSRSLPVNGLQFHRNGQYLVSTTDNSVTLVDCLTGREKKTINCRSNGVGRVEYTHHESCLLVSSSRKVNDIRYLCLHDNRYLRAFDAHTDKVTSLSMSPTDDHFLSGCSGDKSVMMWDLAVANPVAKLSLPAHSDEVCVRYDKTGLVFGVMRRKTASANAGGGGYSISLYDARNYDKGPFQDIAPDVTAAAGGGSGAPCTYSHLVDNAFHRAYYYADRLLQNPNLSVSKPPLPPLPPSMSSHIRTQLQKHAHACVLWTDFEFSLDGNHILVNSVDNGPVPGGVLKSRSVSEMGEDGFVAATTSSSAVLVLDGFRSDIEPSVVLRSKKPLPTVAAAQGSSGAGASAGSGSSSGPVQLGACFSSDGRYVLVANEDHEINVYEKTVLNADGEGPAETMQPTVSCTKRQTLLGHTTPASLIRCNPRYDVVASASSSGCTALWIHSGGAK